MRRGQASVAAAVGAVLLAVTACHGRASEPPHSAMAEVIARPCAAPAADMHYDQPESVYAAYARAINEAHWCEAIAIFDRPSQPRVAITNFKGLALLAGTPNPKQRSYAAAFKQFCRRHALDCTDDHWLARFVPIVMRGGQAQQELATVSKRAEAAPADMYRDVMTTLLSVDASAMAHLDTTLASLDKQGETAVGTASRAGGMPTPISFVRGDEGWKISLPN